jgi:hypothetical protein
VPKEEATVAAAATASKPAQASPQATQAPAQQALPATSRLAAAKKGRLAAPSRYLVYGLEGTGKTTFASYAPDPIWIDADDGSAKLDVARYPFRDGPGGHVPRSYGEITGAVDDLIRAPHSFKTLVLDTVDRLEPMLWRHMIDRDNPKVRGDKMESIEDYGYGKGYNQAVDEWRALCARLDRLREIRGMSIVLLAHSTVKNFKNPEGSDYDRYQLAIHEKAAGFLKGWSDIVGFLRFEEGVAEEKRTKRGKGWSTGVRIMHLGRTAAYDAKGRGGMPDQIEVPLENPWAELAKAEATALNTKAEDFVARIEAELTRIGGDEELKGKVRLATETAVKQGDLEALGRYLNALASRPAAAVVSAANE